MPEYTAAPQVALIAERLIGKHHTRLADARVECVFRDTASKSGGREVCGKARKVTGLNAFLASEPVTSKVDAEPGDPFFLIEIAKDKWDVMTAAQRDALVDHELCHCALEYDDEKDDWKLSIRPHDVESFAEEVERHGLWTDDLLKFADAVKTQETLALDEDEQ